MSLPTTDYQIAFALLRDAPVGLAVASADREVILLEVNPALCRLLGYAPEELRGQSLVALGHPDDAPSTDAVVESTLAAGASQLQIEKRYRRADGGWAWVLASALQVGPPGEPPERLLIHFVDITERKEAEHELASSERRYREIVEHSQEGFCEFDADQVLTYVNPRLTAMFGYSAQEIVGRRAADFMFDEDRPLSAEYQRRRSNGVGPTHYEFRFRRRDGGEIWTQIAATLRTGPDGFAGGFSFISDITETRAAREELRRAVELQRVLTNHLPDTVAMLYDHDLRFMLVGGAMADNPVAQDLVGRTLAEIPGLPEDTRRRLESRYRRALAGEEQSFEVAYGDRMFEVTISPVPGRSGAPEAGLLVARDVSEAHRNHERLVHMAENDQLTGLPNRVSFRVALDDALHAAAHGMPAVLMLLDMNNFKSVNDSLGHDAGDELLRVVADRLRAAIRPDDVVARLSGDEFIVLMSGVHGAAAIDAVARRVLSVFASPALVHGQEIFATASVGVARLPDDGVDAPAALKAADMAMYAAKREGHNVYRVFRSAMAEQARARLRTSSALHRAVTRGELSLHYLPQLSLTDGRPISVEALVRWHHPERGLLLPDQFIAVAEESGLIVELGEWVLDTACQQLSSWQARGVPIPRVAVNVSMHQLRHAGFPDTLAGALERSRLGPGALELEITESALMDRERAAALVAGLKSNGVRIAIDDFGTGYSSLGRLRRLPIDLLKIDRTFVADLGRDPDAVALARSIVNLAHNLGLTALAEGVERTEQRELLRDTGCDFAAGWLWSEALPAAEVEAWVAGR